MSELSRKVSPPGGTCHMLQRKLASASSSTTSVFNWNREREAKILTKKINSRFVELEKVGAEAIKDLEKLCRWVDGMVEEARLAVEKLEAVENIKKSYQEVSKILVEAEDNIAMLAASIGRWQTGELSVTEPEPSLHDGAEEEVKKESGGEMSEQMDEKKNDESALVDEARIYVEYKAANFDGNQNNKSSYDEKDEHDPKQNCHDSDKNNNLVIKEKPPGSVVIIYNLNPQFMDCGRLFNLISPYALVKSIKFLQKGGFQKAMVELNNNEGAKRVMQFIQDEVFFGETMRLEPSPKLRVTEFNPQQLPSLPNGTKAFKDFSQDNRKLCLDHSGSSSMYPSSMYPPSRTIYFWKTREMSDEDFKEFFEKLKAPVPYIIMWFRKCGGNGCLQFKTKEEALKAMCIANLALTKSGRRVHLAFTYERKDWQFYSEK